MKKSYSAKAPVPNVDACAFPLDVEHKGSVVSLYQSTNRGVVSYTIGFHSEGRRQLRTRRSFDDAFKLAQELALRLGNGASGAITLAGEERFVYDRAIDIAASLAMPLDLAVSKLAEAAGILRDPALIVDAAKFYVEAKRKEPPPISVADVVAELIDTVRAKGKSDLYVRDLRVRLQQRFVKAFQVTIASVTTADIEAFLGSIKGGPRHRKNYLGAIGRLFTFAARRGYLPDGHPGISRVEFDERCINKVETFTPEEMAKLLAGAKPDLIPPLALGAFCGVRAEEIKRLDWSDVRLSQKVLIIPAMDSKTGKRRVVDISPNLSCWLRLRAKEHGPVCAYANLALQYGKLARETGVKWKRNGPRSSYISYRLALIDNIHKVANEAGNSPSMIRSNYLKMATKADAKRWFAIRP